MPILNPGATARITLQPGQVVSVNSGLGLVVEPGGQHTLNGGRELIGEFPRVTTVEITAQTAIDYIVEAGSNDEWKGIGGTEVVYDPANGSSSAGGSPVLGAGVPVLDAATAGTSSAWIPYVPGMRLAYALDSGSTSTNFSVDISADGSTSLGQAFTGTWANTTAEISPPIWLSNPAARFIRFNVLTGGPLSVIRF